MRLLAVVRRRESAGQGSDLPKARRDAKAFLIGLHFSTTWSAAESSGLHRVLVARRDQLDLSEPEAVVLTVLDGLMDAVLQWRGRVGDRGE